MQLKPITAITVLLIVCAVLIAGCTVTQTSNHSPTATPVSTYQPTYTPTSSSDNGAVSPTEGANRITKYLQGTYGSEIIIVTPFVYKGLVNGHMTYTGVIKDGSSKLKVWNRTITYTLCNDRSEAKTVFSQAKTTATSKGYGSPISSDTYWIAMSGGNWADTVGSKKVAIHVCQPGDFCGEDYWVSFNDYFVVATEYMTRIE